MATGPLQQKFHETMSAWRKSQKFGDVLLNELLEAYDAYHAEFPDPDDRQPLIDRAKAEYAVGSDDDIEIDEDAAFSRSDDKGWWVSAWVFVRDEGNDED